ncbi:MAG: AraC-like DNA-binding protein [Parvicella sp.]|jgi:AraC-like DNA-binding protein
MILEDIYLSNFEMRENKSLSVHIAISLLPHQNAAKEGFKKSSIKGGKHIRKTYDIQEIELKAPNLLETINNLIEKRKKTVVLIDSDENGFLSKVDSVIEGNFDNSQFTIPFLCNELGVSRSHFYRKILALTDRPAIKYINSFRLSKAMEMIIQGKLTLQEIAYNVGYNDNSYFSRSFKKEFGKAPSFYRSKANTHRGSIV